MTCAPTVRVAPRPAPSIPSSGHLSIVPNGLAGSVAASSTTSGSSGSSRSERINSSAAGSANCVAPTPPTKEPPADAAGVLERLEDVIHGAEAAENALGARHFPCQHAVAREQLL